MQFGLFGGARTKRSVGIEDSQGYESFIDYVIEADRLGFKQLFMVEHHFTGQGQVSASMAVLAYLAARTRKIRLGTAVVVLPWHNPVLVAEQAATLDLLSGGRVDFGVGKGYRQAEFDGFCIPMAEATERFDEAMEIIRKAWTTQGRFSHHGKRWHYDNIVVEPEPLQRPHPPLWLAAGSPDSVRRAAREGYNLLLDQLAQTDQIVRRIALFREECERAGRPYDFEHGGDVTRVADGPQRRRAAAGLRDAQAGHQHDRRPGARQACRSRGRRYRTPPGNAG